MAKRKLSESQRASISKELGALLRTSKTKAEALRAVAKKYGITTITARWYAKSLKGPAAPATKPAKAAATKPQAKQAPKAPAARNGTAAPAFSVAGRLVAGVKAIAERTFARARQAKALIPQWQAYVTKEFSLRKAEKRVREELREVAGKAQALDRRIKELAKR